MSMIVNPYIFDLGGGAGPGPHLFSIPGGDGESGAADWTVINGSPPLIRSGVSGFTGNHFVGPNAGSGRARHVWYDIPSGYFSDADAGLLTTTLNIDYSTIDSDTDNACFVFEYYDGAGGTGNFLGYSMAPPSWTLGAMLGNDTFTNVDLVGHAPAGTRSFTFVILMRRTSGTELSFYWEMNSLTLDVGSVHRSPILFSDWKADVTSALSGWTVTTGSIASSADVTAEWGLLRRWGGSQAALEYNKAVTIPSAASAALAAGSCTARLRRAVRRDNNTDATRTFCAFYDAGATLLSVVEDTAAPAAWTQTLTYAEFTAAVPAGAVSAKMHFVFDRNDGTVMDGRIHFTEVDLLW